MSDVRVTYIANCVSSYLRAGPPPPSALITSFLDSSDFSVLQVLYDSEFHFRNDLQQPPQNCREVHFIKLIPRPLSENELSSQIVIGSLGQDSLSTLYRSLSAISIPLLKSGKLDLRLSSVLEDLVGGLSYSLKESSGENITCILTPTDEIEYWNNVSNDYRSDKQEQGKAYMDHYGKIMQNWANFASLEFAEFYELIETTGEVLESIWKDDKFVYPQDRMERVLHVVADAIPRKMQTGLGNMWEDELGNVVAKLNEGLKAVQRWVQIMQSIPNCNKKKRKWQGKEINVQNLVDFQTRVEEIIEIKSQMDELLKLLTPENQKRFKLDKIFEPLKKINPFQVSEYSKALWEEAKSRYNANIQGPEEIIAGEIRKKLLQTTETNFQIRYIQTCKGLISRPNIKKALQNEREQLLSQIVLSVESLKQEFDQKSTQSSNIVSSFDKLSQENMSPLVSSIVWARQLYTKLNRTYSSSEWLLADLENFKKLRHFKDTLGKKLEDYQKQSFGSWCGGVDKALSDKSDPIALDITGKLMELDLTDGFLKVGFSDKLVQLIKEVRQLLEYGFDVPKNIKTVALEGKKYCKEAITLKQVANFYNNMSSQILECQKRMLLGEAIAFEEVVKNTKSLSSGKLMWNSSNEVAEYIKVVQKAANELMGENRKLRKVHFEIIEKIKELQSIDLLKYRQMWKDKLNEIRRNVEAVSDNKDPTGLVIWKTALDKELYKALEVQYKQGLENLSQNLPDIKIDLSFMNKTLQFRPPLEEIKSKYYTEIRLFISIPITFQGFGGSPEIYRKMPDKSSDLLYTVYKNAENLFVELKELQVSYKHWCVLGRVNIENLVEEKIKTVEDFDHNFKTLRQKRKDIERIPDSHKIHCFNISTTPLKSSLEDQLQRLSDALIVSLKTTIKFDAELLTEFLKTAQAKLNQRPQTVEEITQAQKEILEVVSHKEKMQVTYDSIQEKSKSLRQITGTAPNLAGLNDKWEGFLTSVESFKEIIEQQREVVKKDIQKRIDELALALEKFESRWNALKPKPLEELKMETAIESSERIREWREDWNGLKDRTKGIIEESEHFGVPVPKFDLQKVDKELSEQTENWRIFEEFREELKKLSDEDWLSFRSKLYLFQEFFVNWSDKLKSRSKEAVTRFIHSQIEMYKRAWPLLKLSTGEGFEKEHWKTLFHYMKLGKEVTMENLKLNHFIESIAYVIASADQIKELQARSQGEVTIREAIQELRVWCDEASFSLFEHVQNDRVTPLIKDWKELMTQVSDNQSLLSSLKESRYFSRFADQVSQFESKLSSLDEYLSRLAIIQRKWVYLEPIFGRGSLPQEQSRFRRIDDDYRNIMLGVGMDPKVVSLCNIPGLKDTLDMLIDQLERCQKALNDFLEEKRSKFPRFYFIGDDDLLEILGQAKNPTVIQTHLKKLFSGIYRVEFGDNNSKIIAFLSSAGERVQLHNAIRIVDDVEIWLDALSREMQSTLSKELINCLKTDKVQSILPSQPSQLCSLSEVITFSEQCVKAIEGGTMNKLKADLQRKLAELTSARQTDALMLIKVKSLILDLIHNMEVSECLIENKVSSTNDWQWHRQLKFFIQQSMCMIHMVEAVFNYTYEYQGNAPKLVHTPLTDKCYLTLTQGMMMGYGGNPYGPAGTVKALGQAFGRQVLVFNCDEGIDFKSMGRIFIGLVKCGAWGCFDEFNRLLEEQLSAISQQIQVIQWAIKNSEKSLELLGRVIEVNQNAGIFVTMNPAGKGYGGRSKLPDNLKMLFRPVAMSVPDNELIAEVLLFSEGFQSAKSLSKKLVELFILSRQLLSSQQHYDWGLRALKTTLTIGGQIIQSERAFTPSMTPAREAIILIKAIRINTLPKLTYADLQKFSPLVNDIFIGSTVEDIRYDDLEQAIRKTLEEQKLEYSENQVSKILQFYESTMQRMGVVLVGPSGCGKSTIWKVLKSSLSKLNKEIKTHIMNPKSMPRQQLLGHMDNDTREWNEGVLTAAARECVKQPLDVRSWVICDGDIDPEWIESLNSVLDDNHLLTLPTGERISFADNVNFIFETNDLRFASPATVSRMGMIFMSEEDVDIRRLIVSWMKKQPTEDGMRIERWVEEILMTGLEWALLNHDDMIVPTTKVGIVMSALSMLSGIKTKTEFVYAVIRGIGSNFKQEQRVRFASEMFSRGKENPPDPRYPLDCFYNDKAQSLKPFVSENEKFDLGDFADAYEPPIVRTVGIQRDIETFRTWLENGQPFIVVGPEGCGKNLMLKSSFKLLKSTQVAVLNCNAQTSANHVIQKLLQVCVQSTSNQGKVLRPKDSSRLILYLKDINLPTPDKYDTIQLIALLQQLVSYQGFYDGLEFVSLERVQIVASMNPSSVVGRHALSPRFTAIVRIVSVDYPSRDELIHIYTVYLKNILKLPNLGNNINSAGKLATAMVEMFTAVRSKFVIDDYKHYLFTPRDITQWVVSLLRYEAKNMPQLCEVWGYEASRIFKDRLVLGKQQKNHVRLFENLLQEKLRQDLGYNDVIDCYYTTWSATHEGSGPPMGRVTGENLENIMKQGLLAYEREYRELHMHIFSESLLSLAIANRILSRPGGCMLLVGESGIGRRNVTLLSSHMLNLQFVSFNITREYSNKEFRRDLKLILQLAGIEGKPTTMFIEDYQLVNPEFLQLLNGLLSSGEVPGLYTSDEIEPLLVNLADEMRQIGGFKSLYEFFVSRVKKNLRTVLSLDFSHPLYELNCANNPALYTRCSVVWMKQWSEDSLKSITQIELHEQIQEIHDKQDIIKLAMYIHSSVPNGVLRNFIDLLKTFRKIYALKVNSQGGQSSHLKAGLDKLKEAEKLVDDLRISAEGKKKLLAVKQKEADEALKKITEAMAKAAERRQEVETLQKNLEKENTKINQRKSQVESELDEIQPAVEEARKAVGSIKKENLDEIKALRMPPEPVHDVLCAVLRLMGSYDTSWNSCKEFLKGRSVIASIMNFDPRNITPEIREDVEKLVRKNASSFEDAVIQRASVAAASLATWVKNLLKCSVIFQKVKPLEDDLYKATKNLEASQKRVMECENELNKINLQVEQLKEDFSKRTSEAEKLKNELASAESTLSSAQELLGKLSGEKKRWEAQLKELKENLDLIPKYSMLSAGFSTYLSAYSEDVRESLLKKWKTSCGTNSYEFKKFMSSESEILRWKGEGLPEDQLSTENAIVLFNSVKTPLIVDPATAATTWLKTQNSGKGEVLNQSDPRFTSQFELGVRFGKVIVVQEIDRLEPMLFPLLRLDLIKQGPRFVVQIGDKQIDYNESFRLYLCTRDSSIEVPSNSRAVITFVNFTVTRSGLEGQLLSLILNHEQPELEKKKTEMLAREEHLKVQLADLEKELLEELATATGNILENKSLIESLNRTKTNSIEIGESLKKSQELQASVDRQREEYRPLASNGSTIFSSLQDLKKVNNMYQFSLVSFIKLFNKALLANVTSSSLAEKLEKLRRNLVKLIFVNVCRAIFKADILMFGLHFCRFTKGDLFEPNEWEFLKGEVAASGDAGRLFPLWASEDRRDEFGMLAATLPKVINYIQLDNNNIWEPWGKSGTCEKEFPSSVSSKMTSFQKLLLVKVLRPDRLESAMHLFVCEALGESDVSPPPLSLMDVYRNETIATEPILFIVSPGSDPTKELEEFAEAVVGRDKFHQMAMGGGQNDEALKLLKECAHKGHWLCLKNLHIVTGWLPLLEKELKIMKPNDSFRLWLTTEPHSKFPAILLQSSLKISYESPPGIKKNLQRTYLSITPEDFEKGSVIRAQALFSLAWFHAIVQERRTYIPQGWSKFYEFSLADIRTGINLLEKVLERAPVQWSTLRGLLENAVYGGRIDNFFDIKVLQAYLEKYFSETTFSNGILSQGIKLPNSKSYKEYIKLIDGLSDVDSPKLFGLPLNINRSVQRFNSANVIKQIKQLSAISHEDIKFDREQWSEKLGPISNLWKTMLKSEDRFKGKLEESEDSLSNFVITEARYAFKMLEKVNESLESISKVISGNELLTSSIEQDGKELLMNQVPESWSSMWEGPNSPVAWLRALVRKTSALKRWLEAVHRRTLFNEPVTLGELFHPETFLNVLRQVHARKIKHPMELLKLVACFDRKLEGGIMVRNILLQGCDFRNTLITSVDNSSDLAILPEFSIAWIKNSDPEPVTGEYVRVPLYNSLEREKSLCTLALPNQGNAEERIISGVALFLSGSDE
ncbi:hypothetical protein SteCoe_4833 [Stentor coeruleus]|uniref:Cytoplasmic dynein 2 heavy chain 1 n=1 Tax=Stentor coeruleus TaxID=5963 RepID=A0A1R2CTT3_9CILI|nr:hypothetical protein SteCoe_4833 [Stentor coeruleus]